MEGYISASAGLAAEAGGVLPVISSFRIAAYAIVLKTEEPHDRRGLHEKRERVPLGVRAR